LKLGQRQVVVDHAKTRHECLIHDTVRLLNVQECLMQDYVFVLLQETAVELYEESVHEKLKKKNKDLLGMANGVNQ
jgi:hypothetical protein